MDYIELDETLFEYLEDLKRVKSRSDWHPERSAFNHSIQCFNMAMRESNDIDLILAALFHDVGKCKDMLDHANIGAEMCEDYLSVKSLWLIKNHIKVKDWLSGNMKRLQKSMDLFEHPWFLDLVHLRRIDLMGRNANIQHYKLDRDDIIKRLNNKVEDRWRKES